MNESNVSEGRCLASEAKAQEALLWIAQNQSEIKGLDIPPIVKVTHEPRNSRMDGKGADLFAHCAGIDIPVQVKSSERCARKFERKQRYRLREGKQVIVNEAIVVDPLEPLAAIIPKMIAYLNRICAFVRRIADGTIAKIRTKLVRESEKKNRHCGRLNTHQMMNAYC